MPWEGNRAQESYYSTRYRIDLTLSVDGTELTIQSGVLQREAPITT